MRVEKGSGFTGLSSKLAGWFPVWALCQLWLQDLQSEKGADVRGRAVSGGIWIRRGRTTESKVRFKSREGGHQKTFLEFKPIFFWNKFLNLWNKRSENNTYEQRCSLQIQALFCSPCMCTHRVCFWTAPGRKSFSGGPLKFCCWFENLGNTKQELFTTGQMVFQSFLVEINFTESNRK